MLATRKDAVAGREGELGIIPGSIGARSDVVRGKGNPERFHGRSHGAARTVRRCGADDRARATAGVVDEIAMPCKDIDAVMAAQSGLVEVAHTLKQVVCVKG